MKRLTTLALGGLLLSSAAQAAPATTTFNVTITITKECAVSQPTDINFGDFGAIQAQTATITQTTTFTVICSKATPYTIAFTGSNDVVGTATIHQMKGAIGTNTNLMQYNLFDITGGASTTPLGGSAAGAMISDTGTGASQSKTLQGKLINPPPATAVQADTYSDLVTMTVTY